MENSPQISTAGIIELVTRIDGVMECEFGKKSKVALLITVRDGIKYELIVTALNDAGIKPRFLFFRMKSPKEDIGWKYTKYSSTQKDYPTTSSSVTTTYGFNEEPQSNISVEKKVANKVIAVLSESE